MANEIILRSELLREIKTASAPLRETAVATLKRPKAIPFTLPPTLPPDDYLDLAAAIGLDAGPAMDLRLGRFFVDRGWLIYPYQRVWNYLLSLCERTGPRWEPWEEWQPRPGRIWARLARAAHAADLAPAAHRRPQRPVRRQHAL